jgi:hypothetical protein
VTPKGLPSPLPRPTGLTPGGASRDGRAPSVKAPLAARPGGRKPQPRREHVGQVLCRVGVEPPHQDGRQRRRDAGRVALAESDDDGREQAAARCGLQERQVMVRHPGSHQLGHRPTQISCRSLKIVNTGGRDSFRTAIHARRRRDSPGTRDATRATFRVCCLRTCNRVPIGPPSAQLSSDQILCDHWKAR